MSRGSRHIRVVTYNVHKCRGMDNRVRPERVARVLKETRADIIGLQEVLSLDLGPPAGNQAEFIASELGMEYAVGENRKLKGGVYGNVILSRFPIHFSRNYDISVRWREQRGCLRTDIQVAPDRLLHVFNVHMGTNPLERRRQVRKLVDKDILHNEELSAPRVVLGDFNEWTRGLTTRLLTTHLQCADVRKYVPSGRTYPGLLPLLHLDQIYFDPALHMSHFSVCRSRAALVASDHVPLVADFVLDDDRPDSRG